jgi:ABC-type phosphate transport system substrate-binding protein
MRFLLLIFGVLWTSVGQAEELLVIASTQVPDATISVKQLADIYLMKKTFWADKTQVVPVNREASSAEREKFSAAVFNLSLQEQAEYLNRLSFQGKLPPLVQTSDQAVLGFVRSVPGAIGYINANQAPTGVKVLLRLP